MSTLNLNNPSGIGSPNQAAPGTPLNPATPGCYLAAATGTTMVVRKGPNTYIQAPAALTGSIVLQPVPVAALGGGWLLGDIIWFSAPTHTGGGFTATVNTIAAAEILAYAALLSFGGAIIFNGTDFQTFQSGPSTV
jgi:hypothetical protein